MIMMIKDLYLQMISIIDFIYIHKTIGQVSTDPITCGLNFLKLHLPVTGVKGHVPPAIYNKQL
jgi:hypothetical protein